MIMEEATAELRNAIHLALSLGEPHGSNEDRGNNGDDLLNNDVAAHHHHGSSEGTYISSLSGSLPSDRSNALASRRKNYYAAMEDHNDHHNNHGGAVGGGGGRHVWQKRRLHVASCVENSVSNYEVAVFNYHTGNEALSPPVNGLGGEHHRDFGNANNGTHDRGEDLVDLLVALLTSVPRILLEQTDMPEANIHFPPQEDESYMSSMEQVCYNAACIASDMIQKYFQRCTLNNMANPPMLEESHVHDLIAEVVHMCNTDPAMIAWSNVDPIVRILNSLSEERDIERSMQERDHGYSEDNGYDTIYSILSSKDTLQLFHTQMFRYLCDQEDENTEPSNHVGYFISYLLEHFASAVALDMGYTCPEEATDPLFEAWSDAVDEHLVPRLNCEETRDVHDLVVRYHVSSIQSTLQLIENAESVISHAISASEQSSGVDGSSTTLESIITATRHTAMVVATTEVMDKLGMQHDPEIHTIFHPLMASYARFTASYLHDAMQFLRGTCDSAHEYEYEETSILADDLLFRICRVSLGVEFLKSLIASTGDEEEVLAIALFRASNSQCITGKASFLLEIAADRASGSSKESAGAGSEPTLKRQRFNSGKSGQTLRKYIDNRQSSTEDSHGKEMSDTILACLALSRSNQGDLQPDASTVEKAACLSSALMSTEKDGTSAIDPLNPWHTLQIKPMAKLAALVPHSPSGGDVACAARDNVLSFIQSTPHLFDTSTSGFSLQS